MVPDGEIEAAIGSALEELEEENKELEEENNELQQGSE